MIPLAMAVAVSINPSFATYASPDKGQTAMMQSLIELKVYGFETPVAFTIPDAAFR